MRQKKKLKEFTKKKLKELWESMNEIQGPEDWTPSSFGYYAFIKFGQSMGFKGQLAPMLSAWLGNIVFFIGGIILLIKARK